MEVLETNEQSVMEEVRILEKNSQPSPKLMKSDPEEDQSNDSDVEIVAVSEKASEGCIIGDVIEIQSDEDDIYCDVPLSVLGSSSQAETVTERKSIHRSETFDSLNSKSVNNNQNTVADVEKVNAIFSSLEKLRKPSSRRLSNLRIPWIKSRMKKWPYLKKRLFIDKPLWSRSGSCSSGKTKFSKTQVIPEPIVVYKHISWEDIQRKHKDILPVSISDKNFDEMSVLQELETNDHPTIKSITDLETRSPVKLGKTKMSDIIKNSMKRYPGVELKELKVNLRQCYMKSQPLKNKNNVNACRRRQDGLIFNCEAPENRTSKFDLSPCLFLARFDSDSLVRLSNEDISSEKVNQESIQTQDIFDGAKLILTEVPMDDAIFESLKGQNAQIAEMFISEARLSGNMQKVGKPKSTPATGQHVFNSEGPARHTGPAKRNWKDYKSALSDRVLRIEKLMEAMSAEGKKVVTDHFKGHVLKKAKDEPDSIKDRKCLIGRAGDDKSPVLETHKEFSRESGSQSVTILPETVAVKKTETRGVKRKGKFPCNPSRRNQENEKTSKQSFTCRNGSDSEDVELITINSDSDTESMGDKQFLSKFDLVIRWMLYKTLLPPETTTNDFEKTVPSLMDGRIDTCPAVKAKFERLKSKIRQKWMDLIVVDIPGRLDQTHIASLQAKLHEYLRKKITDDLQEDVNEMMTYQTLCIKILLSLGKILERDKCRLRELNKEEIDKLLKEKSARERKECRKKQTQNYMTVQPKESAGLGNMDPQNMQIVSQKVAQGIAECDNVAATHEKFPEIKTAPDSLPLYTQVNTSSSVSLTSNICVPVSLPLYMQSKISLPSVCVPPAVTVPRKLNHGITNTFKSEAPEVDRDNANKSRSAHQSDCIKQFKEDACRNKHENSFEKNMFVITKASPNCLTDPPELQKRYPDISCKLDQHINRSLTKIHGQMLDVSSRTNLAHKIAASTEELHEDGMSLMNMKIRQSKENFLSVEKESYNDFIIVQNIDDDCNSDHDGEVSSDTQYVRDCLLYMCSRCGKEYKQEASRMQHEYHCKDRGQHKCAICMNAFGSMKALKNHFYVSHPDLLPKTHKTFQKVEIPTHHVDVSEETRANSLHIPGKRCAVDSEGEDNDSTLLEEVIISKTHKPDQTVLTSHVTEKEVSENSIPRHLLDFPPKSNFKTNADYTSSIVESFTEADSKEQLRKLDSVQEDEFSGRQTVDIKKENQIESHSEKLSKTIEWASFEDENAALFPVSLSASLSDVDEDNGMINNAAKPLSIKLVKNKEMVSEKSLRSNDKSLLKGSHLVQSKEMYTPNTRLNVGATEQSEALELDNVKIEEDLVESQKESPHLGQTKLKSESEEKHLLSMEANKHSKAEKLVGVEIEKDLAESQMKNAHVNQNVIQKPKVKSEPVEEYLPKCDRSWEANEAVKLTVQTEEGIAESQESSDR